MSENLYKTNSLEELCDRYQRMFGIRPIREGINNKFIYEKEGIFYTITWQEMFGRIFKKRPLSTGITDTIIKLKQIRGGHA